ncbi:MAG: hypothetical protein WDW38_006014 [Sanguina aurantia]
MGKERSDGQQHITALGGTVGVGRLSDHLRVRRVTQCLVASWSQEMGVCTWDPQQQHSDTCAHLGPTAAAL